MRRRQRKIRLMTGVASLLFFIVASLCFGFALEGIGNNGILGFHISEDAVTLLDVIPFFNTKAETRILYPIGNVENQVILINLSEQTTPWLNKDKVSKAEQLLNSSLTQYISDVSKGSVQVHSTFYGFQDHNVQDGYQLSQPLSYYISDKENESAKEAEMLNEVIEQMNQNEALFEKTKAELDTNDDGYIDNMTFLIRGNKQYEHNMLWPHQFSLRNRPTIKCKDGKLQVKDYMVILSGDDEENFSGTRSGLFSERMDMGVFAHEYLHLYGFPDMYHNYKYENDDFVSLESGERKGDPLGQWEIMDNTISDIPQNPLFYTNMTYAPWGDRLNEVLTITESTKQVELQPLDYTKDGVMAALIRVDASVNARGEDEYFMAEYRKKSGWDEKLPNEGLIVYRINLAANYKNPEKAIRKYCSNKDNGKQTYCGNQFGPPDEVYIFRPGVTDINPAASISHDFGLYDAALSSKHGHASSLGKSLAEVSAYNPKTFADTIYFSDGSNSGIVISNVTETANNTITFDIDVPEPKNDTQKPVIDEKIEGNGIEGRWTNDTAALSLTVTDKGMGLDKIEVISDKGEIADGEDAHYYVKKFSATERIKQTTFTFQAAKNGIYQIKATDLAGNQSDIRTVEVTNIDETPPIVSFGSMSENMVEKIIPITYEDRESGIDADSAYYATMGMREKATGSYPYEIKDHEIRLNVKFQGRVCVIVKDKAGNESAADTCFILSDDKQPPVLELIGDQQTDEWTAMDRTITVKAKDEQEKDSGISYIEITTDHGLLKNDNNESRKLVKDFGNNGKKAEEISFQVSANGNYLVKACDYADFCSAESIHIDNIDRSEPVLSNIRISDDKDFLLFMNGAYNIRFTAHDEPIAAGSGVKQVYYQLVSDKETYEADITSAKWQAVQPNDTITTPVNFEGTVYAYAQDQVGNISNVFQKQITRHTQDEAATKGISSDNQAITVYGIKDDAVSLAVNPFTAEEAETMLGSDFMNSHKVGDAVSFHLEKEALPYALSDEITVRYAMEKQLLEKGSLKLLAVNEDGSYQAVDAKLSDGYLEFTTEEPAYAYVAVHDLETTTLKNPDTVQEAFPQTGDSHHIFIYPLLMILSFGILAGWKHVCRRHFHKM